MLIERQVLITLEHFGIYENNIFLYDITKSAGIGYGTVIIQRVIITLLDTNPKICHICLTIKLERKIAKKWIKNKTCSIFQNKLCIVD